MSVSELSAARKYANNSYISVCFGEGLGPECVKGYSESPGHTLKRRLVSGKEGVM